MQMSKICLKSWSALDLF